MPPPDHATEPYESALPKGAMWGFALFRPHAVRAKVFRNPGNLLWPSAWTHNSIQLAVDGYLVHGGRVLEGRSVADRTLLAEAAMDDAMTWLRGIQNGCFNIVVHDHRACRTLLMSDRFGFLPLYILRRPDGIWFAGDLATLRAIAPTPLIIDEIGVGELYWFGYQIGHRTAYRDVRMIPPGCILTFPWDGSPEMQRSWTVPRLPSVAGPAPAIRDIPFRLTELVEDACRRLHLPGFDYGIKLSGGLDSRLIAACWHASPLRSYTWGHPDSTEVRLAGRLAARLGFTHRMIPVDGDFFPGRYKDMFRRYGIMEFLHELATPFMTRDKIPMILDGLVGDVFIGGGYRDDARKTSWSDLLRAALGIRYRQTDMRPSSDELVLRLTRMIKVPDGDFPILNPDAANDLGRLDDDIHHDIAGIVDHLMAANDTLESVVARFMLLCRTRRYTALQGTTNRPAIQTLYPFIDTDLLHFLDQLPAALFQYRDLYRRVFTESLPAIRDIPAIRSALPFYFPRPAHAVGRVLRGSLERLGKRLLYGSRGHLDVLALDAVQWQRWLAQNADFRRGIVNQLAGHPLVDQCALEQTLDDVLHYRHAVVGTRLMLTTSFLGWHRDHRWDADS